MTDSNERAKELASGGAGVVSGIFNLLAFVLFLAGIITLLYEVYGLLTGAGWTSYTAVDLLDWLGVAPPATQLTAVTFVLWILVTVPLALLLMVLGWISAKVSDLFEKLT